MEIRRSSDRLYLHHGLSYTGKVASLYWTLEDIGKNVATKAENVKAYA